MQDQAKTKEQLIDELAELRQRVAELENLRRFAEASSEGFSMSDLDGHLLYLNPALCRMLDEDRPEDRIGQHLSIYYPDESNRRGREEIEPALKQHGHWEGELPMLSRRGRIVPTWHSGFVIRDERGAPIRLAVAITDITGRKATEEALRRSEERFRVAFEEAPVGIIMGGADGVLLRVNRTFCQMTGYTEDELIGTSVCDITHPEDRKRTQELREQLEAGRILNYTLEKRYLRKDGATFWAHVAAAPIHDREGRVIFGLGIIENITQRKYAEEALAKEHRTLKRLLQASDHERQLIAYDIHDGLAQQLAGAIMQFQVYAHARQSNSPHAAKAFDTAMSMLRQSHVEARRLISGVRPPILDESGVVAAIAHLAYDTAFDDGPKIELRNRVHFQHLAPVMENAIYRIVQEALTNVRIHSQSKAVRISLLQRRDRLRVEIRDWGVGFDPKTIQDNRFGIEGICERARLLGGQCRIRSTLGKGTSVVVILPVVELGPDEDCPA